MKPAHTLLAAALTGALAAQAPVLDVTPVPGGVEFDVSGPLDPFLGIVILSLSDELVYAPGLPPLIPDPVVLDFGMSDPAGVFHTAMPETAVPPGLMIFAQGVTIGSAGMLSSNVGSFVFDVTVPR